MVHVLQAVYTGTTVRKRTSAKSSRPRSPKPPLSLSEVLPSSSSLKLKSSMFLTFRPYQYFQGNFMEVSYVGYECMGTALDAIQVICTHTIVHRRQSDQIS